MKRVLKLVKATDQDDPEITMFVISFEDAQKLLPEEVRRERIYTENKDFRDRVIKYSDSPALLDFCSQHKDEIFFEIYPAELFAGVSEGSNITVEYE